MIVNTQFPVINRKLNDFYKKNGYLPHFFETYNCVEVFDICPSITTRVGMLGGSSNLLIIEKVDKE
jgi:hypothetical protein